MANQITELTANHLQIALYDNFFRDGWRWWLFNTYFYDWESDCLAFNDAGQVIEMEVKLTRADFLADLKKQKHSAFRCRFGTASRVPNKFYYACPWDVIQPEEVPDYAGLVWILNGANGIKTKIIKSAYTLSYESTVENDLYVLIEKSNSKMLDIWRYRGRL